MAKYKLTQHYFDGEVLIDRGTVMDFDGAAPSTAVPLDDEAKIAAAEREKEMAARNTGRQTPIALSQTKPGTLKSAADDAILAEARRRGLLDAPIAEVEDEDDAEDETPKKRVRKRAS